MSHRETIQQPFVTYLERLAEDRGALAALRRGLGQPPGTVADTYRYVMPWLRDDSPPWVEAAYFTVSALFASHPLSAVAGNIGDHMARCRDPRSDDTALERRLVALLAAHPDDLAGFLRHAISFLCSKDVPVNWHQLLRDILDWGRPSHQVQKAWARSFWGQRSQPSEIQEEA